MKKHLTHYVSLLLLPLGLLAVQCRERPAQPGATQLPGRWTNTTHLLTTLYQVVRLPNGGPSNGTDVGTVAIYSEAPDYRLVTDEDEGFTCVDDVARAGLLLLRDPSIRTNDNTYRKLLQLTEFVLHMQADNGYFYNFLWPDRTINRTFRTSQNVADWWSWRALWFLSEAEPFFRPADARLADRIRTACRNVVAVTLRDFGARPRDYTFVKGVRVPKWLPYGSGSDQAAVMLLGLANYGQIAPDARVTGLIEQLAEGILAMQAGTATQFPYGAILSFENGWHAYGSDQAYALLRVGKQLNKPDWVAAARREIDQFYPYLLRENFLESFDVEARDGGFVQTRSAKFPQIAYGVRPMIWAALEAYEQTKDARYADLAAQLAGWFVGRNVANALMYDQATGRGYDGIVSATQVNRNAGAESTIEALLAFQRLEQYPNVVEKLGK